MHGAVTAENVSSFLPPVVAARTYSAAERSYGGLDVAPSEEKLLSKHRHRMWLNWRCKF